MKKYIKKLISVVLSLLMIITTFPLSAIAGQISDQMNCSATGVYMFNQDEDRFNSDPNTGYYKVCNDGRDGNFTMAYFKYDVSEIAAQGITVDSAPFTVELQEDPMGDCQGLTFYYTNNKMADYLPDGVYRTNETSVFGIDNMHLTNAIGFFNLLPIQTFEYDSITWKARKSFTVDIAAAINSAIADGRNTCVIMIAQKRAGGANDTGGWTDTKIRYGNVPVTYTATTEYTIETQTINRTKYGMISKSDGSRLDTSAKTYNIVNDGEDGNFSIGFWQFDTTSLANQAGTLYSAPMTVTMPSQTKPPAGAEWNGISFYYCDNTAADSLSEGNNDDSDDSDLYGENGQHLTKAISKYNMKQLQAIPASSLNEGGTSFEIDISPAINASKAAGRSNVTIMVVQTRAGQTGSSGGWTDVKLNYDIASVTCTYDADEEITNDLESANRIIAAYESKMANLNANTQYIYNDMKPAYDAYLIACRYRDAAIYGRNEEAKSKLTTALATLSKTTKNMVGWRNRVSSKANKVPTFTATPEDKMQQFSGKLIDNILYTTNVSGTAGGESTPTGWAASALYQHTTGEKIFYCSVYYPTATVVLYDGFTTPKIPVMMSGKANYSDWESIIYSVFPAASVTGKTDRTDIYMINKFNRMNNKYYCWVGSGADNAITSTCDFDWSQNHPYHWIGVDASNSINGYSCSMNNGWTAGDWKKLMYYSSALIVDDKFNFKGEGYYKWNDLHWRFIAGNRNTSDAAGRVNSGQTNEDNYLYYGQLNNAAEEHAIYAINYKAIVDVLKSSPGKPNLVNVANYKAGGLNALLDAYADAAAYDPATADFSNTQAAVEQVGNTIKAKVAAVNDATCTEDTDDYEALRTAITTCERTFDLGNENNKNYTAESWAPFYEAFNTAIGTMSDLYTSNYSTAVDENGVPSTQVKADALMDAYDKLVINREVVDTTQLEIVLNNAIAIASNSRYFVESTITSSNIVELVKQCKIAVWGDEESYGLPARKLEKTPENEAIVANYVTQLAEAINMVELNKNATVPGTGKSLYTAIYEANQYEADKNNYSNYAVLETALNNAQTLEREDVSIDPYVKDQAQSIIDRYVDYVTAIDNAIRELAPAFNRDTLPNGTVANSGTIVETSIKSSKRPNMWNLKWRHSTNVAYFKTTREESVFQLPISEMELYCGQTGDSYFFMLDSLNLMSETTETGDIKEGGVVKSSGDPDCSLDQAKINGHPGNLSVMNGAVTLAFDSIKITQKSNTAYGKDLNGNNIDDPDYDYKKLLESSEGKVFNVGGTNQPAGGILALNGTTSFNLKTSVTAPAITGSPSAVTLPSVATRTFDAEQAGIKIGYLAYWKYSDNAIMKYCGYNYEHTGYDERIDIIDLCFLFDLIDIVEGMSGEANNYTNQSWNNLMAMLSNAKSDLNYSSMTTDNIIKALDKRYSDLWEAKASLKAPANNLSLKAAIESTKEIYANDQSKCSPETWAVFEEKYREAMSKFSGDYSDTGVRNYETTEQTVIDALAQALTDAKDALDYLVDFSVVDNAADTLINGIENNKYTMASVLAVKDALAALTYLNMADAERNTHYQSETDFVAAVVAEAESIANIANSLVEAATAVEVLDAAKVDAKAKYDDPDAYSISEIQATLDLLTPYKPVEFQNYASSGTYTVQCAQYANQQEADAAVMQALSNVQIQQYTVTRQNPDGTSTEIGTYPYGTEVTVNSADGTPVDWYYEAVSNTATSKRKLFSTGDGVTFIVKGNTILSTQKASDANMQKVVFINSLNGRPYSIEYVQSGETVDFAQTAPAPNNAYYSFTNFTVNGNVATSATIQNYTVVYANYEYSATADMFKLALVNVGTYGNAIFGESTVTQSITQFTDADENVVGELKYNDRVTLDPAKYACDFDIEDYNFTIDVNGQQYDALDIGRDFSAVAPIYAFVQVKVPEGEFDRYFELLNAPSLDIQSGFVQTEINAILEQVPDLEMEVINYSDSYSFFVHEDAIIVGLMEEEYNLWKNAGVIVNDYTITVTDKVRVNNDGTMSIVGTYCLPQGAEVVESGILFAASKKGAPAVNSMTLAEVETNNKLARMKSTLHTTANQYVITVNIKAGTYYTKYCGYLIYKQNGKNYIVYSNTVDPVVTVS